MSHSHLQTGCIQDEKGVGNTPGLEVSSVNIQSVQQKFFPTRASHFLAVKEKNKRCAKLIDGNNGKTIPGDCGDEKEKPLQSNYKFKKKLKRHMNRSLSNVFVCVCVCTDVWDD